MSKKFYYVWCEYDYGQEGLIFNSEDDAFHWGEQVYDGDESFDDFVEDGLFVVKEATLYVK